MIDGNIVTDMQHHFIPEEVLSCSPKRRSTTTRRACADTSGYPVMADIEGHLEYMDSAGIDMAVMSTAGPSLQTGTSSAEPAIMLTRPRSNNTPADSRG